MQYDELAAWLGDDHGLTDTQITELADIADDIGRRWPDPDDTAEREAALTTAYRILAEDPERVVAELAEQRDAAHLAELRALAGLRQAATMLIHLGDRSTRGVRSQAGFAARAGVNRTAVREWIGA